MKIRPVRMSDELYEKAIDDSLKILGDRNFSAYVKFLIKNYPNHLKK